MAYQHYNYSWEYYPPPYDFLSPTCPPGANPASATAGGWFGGLSGCGCGGKCGHCGTQGLGQLFSSGLDYTQWGWGEWLAVAGGAYLAVSLISDTGKVSRATRVGYRAARRAL